MSELFLAVFASETGTHLIRPPKGARWAAHVRSFDAPAYEQRLAESGFCFLPRSARAFPPLLGAWGAYLLSPSHEFKAWRSGFEAPRTRRAHGSSVKREDRSDGRDQRPQAHRPRGLAMTTADEGPNPQKRTEEVFRAYMESIREFRLIDDAARAHLEDADLGDRPHGRRRTCDGECEHMSPSRPCRGLPASRRRSTRTGSPRRAGRAAGRPPPSARSSSGRSTAARSSGTASGSVIAGA